MTRCVLWNPRFQAAKHSWSNVPSCKIQLTWPEDWKAPVCPHAQWFLKAGKLKENHRKYSHIFNLWDSKEHTCLTKSCICFLNIDICEGTGMLDLYAYSYITYFSAIQAQRRRKQSNLKMLSLLINLSCIVFSLWLHVYVFVHVQEHSYVLICMCFSVHII